MVSLEEIKEELSKKGKYWIVFTGDSLTSCEWVHPNWREIVEYALKEELTKKLDGDWKLAEWGIRCFNFAYDGATTKDILEKVPDILLTKPNLVVSLMGGNDPTFKIPVNEHVQNIVAITELLNANNTKVAWCTSTPAANGSKKTKEYESYAGTLLHVPTNGNFQIVDMFNIYKSFPTEKFFTFISEENPDEGIKEGEKDPHHPNQLGNAYIAKVVLDKVFGVNFDPEKYIADTLEGKKLPSY